jgi:hypothetical protein
VKLDTLGPKYVRNASGQGEEHGQRGQARAEMAPLIIRQILKAGQKMETWQGLANQQKCVVQ